MLLFNQNGIVIKTMLQICFNTSHVTVQLEDMGNLHVQLFRFQYIPCYCSTIVWSSGNIRKLRFNTSHVTVQQEDNGQEIQAESVFQYIPCYCSTKDKVKYKYTKYVSIHPMLLFNSSVAHHNHLFYKFQYIPCYCST